MTNLDIRNRRLHNQGLATKPFERPEDAVRWLGAVQSQDYPGAVRALGLRTGGIPASAIDRAFDEGAILRTHALRPTWHFLVPEDIRWVVELTAPRVHQLNAGYYRKLEIDADVVARSRTVLEKSMEGGRARTREELGTALAEAGIATDDRLRLAYIMMHAELERVICSGPRRGRQFTYMLLEERAPKVPALHPDEALAEFIRRYFQSHGPATLHDFVWWSGLTMADARRGIGMVAGELVQETHDEMTYWFPDAPLPAALPSPTAYLLPNYDEYGSYKHRDAIFDPANRGLPFLTHLIVIDGMIAGSWRRTLSGKEVAIETNTFAALAEPENKAIEKAVADYGRFLALPTVHVSA